MEVRPRSCFTSCFSQRYTCRGLYSRSMYGGCYRYVTVLDKLLTHSFMCVWFRYGVILCRKEVLKYMYVNFTISSLAYGIFAKFTSSLIVVSRITYEPGHLVKFYEYFHLQDSYFCPATIRQQIATKKLEYDCDFEEVYYFHGDVLGCLPGLNAHLDVHL